MRVTPALFSSTMATTLLQVIVGAPAVLVFTPRSLSIRSAPRAALGQVSVSVADGAGNAVTFSASQSAARATVQSSPADLALLSSGRGPIDFDSQGTSAQFANLACVNPLVGAYSVRVVVTHPATSQGFSAGAVVGDLVVQVSSGETASLVHVSSDSGGAAAAVALAPIRSAPITIVPAITMQPRDAAGNGIDLGERSEAVPVISASVWRKPSADVSRVKVTDVENIGQVWRPAASADGSGSMTSAAFVIVGPVSLDSPAAGNYILVVTSVSSTGVLTE